MEVGVEFNSLLRLIILLARLSFLIGNREIVSKFKTVRSQFDYGTSLIYQKAAVAALNGPQEYVADNRAEYELRRNALVAGIKKLGLKPLMLKAQCLYGLLFLTAIPVQLIMLWNFLIRLVFYVHLEAASKPWRRSCKICPCTSP